MKTEEKKKDRQVRERTWTKTTKIADEIMDLSKKLTPARKKEEHRMVDNLLKNIEEQFPEADPKWTANVAAAALNKFAPIICPRTRQKAMAYLLGVTIEKLISSACEIVDPIAKNAGIMPVSNKKK